MFFLPIKKLQNAWQQIKTRHDGTETLVCICFAQTKLGSIKPKIKSIWGFLSTPHHLPPEQSEAEWRGAPSILNGSSTLTNALKIIKKNWIFSYIRPPGSKNYFPTNSRLWKTMIHFFFLWNLFALVYVNFTSSTHTKIIGV